MENLNKNILLVTDKDDRLKLINNFFGFLVNQTSLLLRRHLEKHIQTAGYKLSAEEFAILIRIWIYNPVNQSELTNQTFKDYAYVSRTLDKLINVGYVTKEQDPSDRRNNIISLSESGFNLYENLIPLIQAIHRDVLNEIDPEELEICRKVLRKAINNLSEKL